MTVAELIAHLQNMPQDVTVVYDCCSEVIDMELKQVVLVKAEDRKLIRHYDKTGQYQYITWDERYWPKYKGEKPEQPEFVTVVNFPGN